MIFYQSILVFSGKSILKNNRTPNRHRWIGRIY
jgi:hypothetical protein